MRIVNLPEETELSEGDYIAVDSEEGSPVKMPASVLIPEEEEDG